MTKGGWVQVDGQPVHVCGDVARMTDRDVAALQELVRAVRRTQAHGPEDVMTPEQALEEAKRRWGATAFARIQGNARCVGLLDTTGTKRKTHGRGHTWEEAFGLADEHEAAQAFGDHEPPGDLEDQVDRAMGFTPDALSSPGIPSVTAQLERAAQNRSATLASLHYRREAAVQDQCEREGLPYVGRDFEDD